MHYNICKCICITLTDAKNTSKWIKPIYVEAKIGEKVTFNCKTKLTRTIPQWLFDYKNTVPKNAMKNGTTITISNVRHSTSGLYHCFGMYSSLDEFDKYHVATARLKVLGKFSIPVVL